MERCGGKDLPDGVWGLQFESLSEVRFQPIFLSASLVGPSIGPVLALPPVLDHLRAITSIKHPTLRH